MPVYFRCQLPTPPTPQEVSKQWQALVDAINQDKQAEALVISRWLEVNGTEIDLEAFEALSAVQKRMVCAWCTADLGPTDADTDSHGICSECGASFLDGD